MTPRIKQIMFLIWQESRSRIGGDEVTRLHAVQMEISLAIGEQMQQIREKERKGGPPCPPMGLAT